MHGAMPQSTSPLTRDTLIARASGLLMAEVDGETVLMSVARGSYFGLAATAEDIWRRLDGAVRAGDLVDALAATYDGDAARIEADTLVFLDRMAAAGLIELS